LKSNIKIKSRFDYTDKCVYCSVYWCRLKLPCKPVRVHSQRLTTGILL